MANYLFNSNIHGYESANVDNFEAEVSEDDTLIIIIDEACTSNSSNYYKVVDKALRSHARVILISVDDGNSLFDALASNMLVYNNYGIYKVVDKDAISAPYLLKVIDRNPDLTEARAYLDKEIVAYQDMCTLLYGIESLVNEGNIEGLKNHVERHMSGIEGMVSSINKMKKTCEMFNSNELIDNINSLKEKIEELNENIDKKNEELKEVKYVRDTYKVETEDLKREVEKIKANGGEAKQGGQNVISTYTAYNTSIHANNKALVIYFKEVSYVRYMNTFISILLEYIEKLKYNCKLLIYDNNTNMLANYGIDVVTGSNYAASKNIILKSKKKIVVAEPFQAIIQDIVSSSDAADIVIVYDRLRQYEDIIKGNNVTKFFVINSASDVTNTINNKLVSGDDTSYIITDAKNSYKNSAKQPGQFLDIPFLCDNFSAGTPSAKFQKYVKAKTTRTGVPLIETVLKKSHVETNR